SAARRVYGGDPGAAARSQPRGGARAGAPGAAQRAGRPQADARRGGTGAAAAGPAAALTALVACWNVSSPRDARRTSRVSTVKRARVVRPILLEVSRHDSSHSPRAGPDRASRDHVVPAA